VVLEHEKHQAVIIMERAIWTLSAIQHKDDDTCKCLEVFGSVEILFDIRRPEIVFIVSRSAFVGTFPRDLI